MTKPFSQACENNKQAILQVLRECFASRSHVLEIGSGTGQHAVHFAPQLAHLVWQTSDVPAHHSGIRQWLDAYPSANLRAPLSLTIGQDNWPEFPFDGVFSANTTHIMQPDEARLMMQLIGDNLPAGGVFCQYGPFNRDGQYTSESNRQFDLNLKAQGFGGLRDICELQNWASKLTLQQIVAMPANNLCLVWQANSV